MARYRLRLQLQEFELPPGRCVVGRDESCTLTLHDASLSREHAVISSGDDSVTVRDLDSRNGTWVNGARILAGTDVEVRHGDRIRFGSSEVLLARVNGAGRDIAATASLRNCRACGAAFVAEAPSCPQCGASSVARHEAESDGRARTETQRRRNHWLSIEVELIGRAMELCRFDQADEALGRMAAKLDALLDEQKTFDTGNLDAALCAAVRFARLRGVGRVIAWALDVLRRLELLPSAALRMEIAATPPILLDEAGDALARLIATHRARGVRTESEASCLDSLESLHRGAVAFDGRRGRDTVASSPEPTDPGN